MINIPNRKCLSTNKLLFAQNRIIDFEYANQLFTEVTDDSRIGNMTRVMVSLLVDSNGGAVLEKDSFPDERGRGLREVLGLNVSSLFCFTECFQVRGQ